jgi:thiamine pyrophosphate-dependent acetolactate synthase large subunit-like protein
MSSNMADHKLDRREFVAHLLRDRGDLMVIGGLGSPTYDVATCGDHPLNFYIWSAMGCAAMVGLGLALARPDRRIAVITGDGEILMGAGSLATIGVKQPRNLAIVVLDNAHYGATGMQPSHTKAGVDLGTIAKGCRFRHVVEVSELARAAEMRTLLHEAEGPVLIEARVAADDPPRVYPSLDGHGTKYRFLQAAGKRVD